VVEIKKKFYFKNSTKPKSRDRARNYYGQKQESKNFAARD
jgi:hypothetical protein